MSTAHLTRLADLTRAHRNRIRSRWRRLPPGQQALLVLAHLRNGDTYTRLAEGFTVGVATVFRYIRETIDLLAACAPSLNAAMWRLAYNGHNLAILDGTVVRTDRLGGDLDRLYYSGKHHHHGVNLQGLLDPRRGDLVWISDGLPGRTHDLTAARTHQIITTATTPRWNCWRTRGIREPFSSWVAVGFDGVEGEDCLHDCGGAAWAAAQLAARGRPSR